MKRFVEENSRTQGFLLSESDEGRPLEAGLQERTSNHLKLRGLRVRVVSVEEKAE